MKLKMFSFFLCLSLFSTIISCEDQSANVAKYHQSSDREISIQFPTNPDQSQSTVVDQSQSTVMDQSQSTVVDQSQSTVMDQSQSTVMDQSQSTVMDQSQSTVMDQSQSTVMDQSQSTVMDQSQSTVMDQFIENDLQIFINDQDGDGIADDRDLAPNDPNWPGQARPDTIYAHTSTKLFALEVKTDRLIEVNDFSFEAQYTNELITDIAFDQNNVLWAISFRKLFICHAQTAFCRYQGALSHTFNGLTWIPGGVVGQAQEILVGLEREGSWYHLDLNQGQVTSTLIGEYPPARLSSGDAFYIDGIGAFASIEYLLADQNQIVKITPENPELIDEVFVDLFGFQKIYGLAGWRGFLYAFDETGIILKINLQTRAITELNTVRHPWWGAGVSTVLYSQDP